MQAYNKNVLRPLALLLIPILILSAVLFKKTGQKEDRIAEQNAAFVLAIEEMDSDLLLHLHVGDRVVDRKNRRILGDITEIRSSQSTAEVYSEAHGRLVEAAVPGKLRVLLTLRGEAQGSEILTASGDPVRLGQTYYFRTYDFSGEGRVVTLA